MAELDTNVRYIKGIGEKKAQSLAKLGVGTLFDLVSFFPRRYEDRSEYKPIALTLPGETVCIRAMPSASFFLLYSPAALISTAPPRIYS